MRYCWYQRTSKWLAEQLDVNPQEKGKKKVRRKQENKTKMEMGGFRFGNLAEVRYFLKQLGGKNEVTISKEKWNEARRVPVE